MGDYYVYEPPRRDVIKDKVADFFQQKNPAQRQQLLDEACTQARSESKSLLNYLLEDHERQQGLKDIEIELKLEVGAVPPDIEEALAQLDIVQGPKMNFLSCAKPQIHTSINTYYGTENQERFVVIDNPDHFALKVKGQSQPYMLGIAHQEYVLKRTETDKKAFDKQDETAAILPFVDSILLGCDATATKKIGSMRKEKATQFIIERNSGRLYSATLAVCRAEQREPLVQFEIEYTGFIPAFPKPEKVESEERIVRDIITIGSHYVENHGMKFTTLTKFDWLAGRTKKTDAPATANVSLEAKVTKLVSGQTLFGEPLCE